MQKDWDNKIEFDKYNTQTVGFTFLYEHTFCGAISKYLFPVDTAGSG